MATRRDAIFDDISVVKEDGDDLEKELTLSYTGLTSDDFDAPEGNQLQQLRDCLPQKDNVRIFLDNFSTFVEHIKGKLSPHAADLDLATEAHLAGMESTLAVMLRTYMKHPDDTALNRANAEQAVGQIQKSLQAFQKTHPKTYADVLKYINASPAMKGRDNLKTKMLLKQLFLGKNPKTALASLMDFTGIQAECVQEANGQQRSSNTHSYAILAAVLGGMGIVAIGVGVAIACTGVGGPVGCGASIAGATLLLLAGTIVCGGGIAAGVMCGRAMKQAKKKNDAFDSEEDNNGEPKEPKITTEAREIPPFADPLIRRSDVHVHVSSVNSFKCVVSSGSSCKSYIHNQQNWPKVIHGHSE